MSRVIPTAAELLELLLNDKMSLNDLKISQTKSVLVLLETKSELSGEKESKLYYSLLLRYNKLDSEMNAEKTVDGKIIPAKKTRLWVSKVWQVAESTEKLDEIDDNEEKDDKSWWKQMTTHKPPTIQGEKAPSELNSDKAETPNLNKKPHKPKPLKTTESKPINKNTPSGVELKDKKISTRGPKPPKEKFVRNVVKDCYKLEKSGWKWSWTYAEKLAFRQKHFDNILQMLSIGQDVEKASHLQQLMALYFSHSSKPS